MGEINHILQTYFEYTRAGIEVEEDGLTTVTFGEFLVGIGAVDRYQLLQALQAQDHRPGARLGDCIAELGFLHELEVEALHRRFARVENVVES